MRRNKKITAVLLLLIAVAIVAAFAIGCSKDEEPLPPTPVPPLTLDKYSYNPGETITVTFTTLGVYDNNAWIGIIPSHIAHGDEALNDQYDISYQYLKGLTSGTMTFAAPSIPGSYDMRMHDTDNSGKEVASTSFTVN